MVDRATFIVRLARESTAGRWSGVIELVGTDERRPVSDAGDVAEFIERSFQNAFDREAAE